MTKLIGTTFPLNWRFGPEEKHIVNLTVSQVKNHFSHQQNLVINTTWFGSQFNNKQWDNMLATEGEFDNLFLIAVIDPVYIFDHDLEFIIKKFNIKNVYKIGMFNNSDLEWNFHAITLADSAPEYSVEQLKMTQVEHVFLLYQRKPRPHRIEITNMIIERQLQHRGVITLGQDDNNASWSQGLSVPSMIIDDRAENYDLHGKFTDFGGVPNDLVSLGRIDLWQKHFLNIVSETEFNDWHPTFVTEKTWKPIIGLRPFIIHGQRGVYKWLQKNGFKMFNKYWPHVPCETGEDQYNNVINVIEFLCNKPSTEIKSMYEDMLPLLEYNRNRFFEFTQEQKYKMENIFHARTA